MHLQKFIFNMTRKIKKAKSHFAVIKILKNKE